MSNVASKNRRKIGGIGAERLRDFRACIRHDLRRLERNGLKRRGANELLKSLLRIAARERAHPTDAEVLDGAGCAGAFLALAGACRRSCSSRRCVATLIWLNAVKGRVRSCALNAVIRFT
jgi:hypothetical protein